jgi:thioredoxin reductase (NADPH)
MRADIVPGAILPDYELPDHTAKRRKLSDLQGSDPMILVLSRGGYCPKDRRQAEGLIQLHREMEVGYCRLVTISTDNLAATNEYRTGVGAHWPFLSDAVLDCVAPGGQAGSSMRIENYLGFPTGLTGAELTDRATLQANKFGAHLSIPTAATRLTFENGYAVLDLGNGEPITTKCLLVATGAQYRRLDVEGFEKFEGTGIYYAATPAEALLCKGCPVIVVGGGNSAGQAAVFLAEHASRVLILIRGDDLNKNMSSYLVRRIEQTANIELLCNATIERMSGNGHLENVEIVDSKTGKRRTVQTPAVFSFIGAMPRTDWLPPEIERDAKGFVRTGAALADSPYWSRNREPFLLETSYPGVFAAGDVRSGSVKRVASAVGEGAMSVQFVHEYLKEM